jgi:hypothetical protein
MYIWPYAQKTQIGHGGNGYIPATFVVSEEDECWYQHE